MAQSKPEQREEGIRAPLNDKEWTNLARRARASGKPRGLRLPLLPPLLPRSRPAGERYRRAAWIGKLAAERADPATVLDQLSRHLERAPTEEALHEAGLLLEELSRVPEAQSHVGRRLTQEAVDRASGEGADRVDQRPRLRL